MSTLSLPPDLTNYDPDRQHIFLTIACVLQRPADHHACSQPATGVNFLLDTVDRRHTSVNDVSMLVFVDERRMELIISAG
jgi:hypothetical protein